MTQRIGVKSKPVDNAARRFRPDARHACMPAVAALLDESEEVGKRMDASALKPAGNRGFEPARDRGVTLRRLDQTDFHASERVDLTPAQTRIPGRTPVDSRRVFQRKLRPIELQKLGFAVETVWIDSFAIGLQRWH